MIKSIIYLISVLALAVSFQEIYAAGGEIDGTSGPLSEYVEINKLLIKALPYDEQPEKNIKKAEELLTEKKSKVSVILGFKRSMVRALRQFISLKDTVGQCDSKNSMILMNNYQAIGGLNADISLTGRIKSVLNHYRLEYAKACREYFPQKFHELMKKFNKDENLARVNAAFDSLLVEDFESSENGMVIWGYRGDLLKMPIRFVPRVVSKIVNRIMAQVRTGPSTWPLMKGSYIRDEGVFAIPQLPRTVIENYLLKPCARYRQRLAPVLDPARIDYVLQVKSEPNEYEKLMTLMDKDKFYHQALVHNRLCGILELEDVYEIFLEKIKNYMDFEVLGRK